MAYLTRVLRVYLNRSSGPLSFWYEHPEINDDSLNGGLGYFMRFGGKASYRGPFDHVGIPLLDYQGDIGLQYNPIAVAQYGLARFNRWLLTNSEDDRIAWVTVADWLVSELRPNTHGVPVWMHYFDWPYKQLLKAPWYSGLAQGNGLSMLVRAAKATGDPRYANGAHAAFQSLRLPVEQGGVLVVDSQGDLWIEEYLVDEPTHILNGFIWALWGVYDYAVWSERAEPSSVFQRCVHTLQRRLTSFDNGWWSLYQVRDQSSEMLASRYYHTLHIVQLKVMAALTGISAFGECADRFQSYLDRPSNRLHALARKAIFKLRHY